MAHKSGLQIAGSAAHLAKAMHDIIKAFMHGGWGAAALQALKHYWPQISAVALILLLLPVIIFCCLPMIMFGYESSADAEISSMTVQAGTVSGYCDSYETYIDNRAEEIKSSVTEGVGQDTETNSTTAETEGTEEIEYEVVFSGTKIQKNRFIALHAVTAKNNLDAVNEADIRSFAEKCVSYEIKPAVQNTESDTGGSATNDIEAEENRMILEIRYLSASEIMTALGFTESDRNWAELIYKALEGGN